MGERKGNKRKGNSKKNIYNNASTVRAEVIVNEFFEKGDNSIYCDDFVETTEENKCDYMEANTCDEVVLGTHIAAESNDTINQDDLVNDGKEVLVNGSNESNTKEVLNDVIHLKLLNLEEPTSVNKM